MVTLIGVLVVFSIGIALFMQQPQFGKTPAGARLEKIKQSSHFHDGKFVNEEVTPDLTEGVSYYQVLKEFIFQKSARSQPQDSLPARKIDLHSIAPEKNILVWFGHSSYFIQLDGKKMLVDPVLSGAASPIQFTTPSYKGSDVYTLEDLPEMDYLFISHDHYDHLDYATLKGLKGKVKKVITGLGTGAHLEHWGYDSRQIVEKDWDEEVHLDSGFSVVTTTARHFSGRTFSRNRSLWVSFVLKTPSKTLFLGGDSGYGRHFAKIGEKYGPFDLAILECGQYDKNWKYIHMMPEEVVQAAQDLHANILLPVHWAKFTLGAHAWDDPILRVTKEAAKRKQALVTPFIGEAVQLGDSTFENVAWWENVR